MRAFLPLAMATTFIASTLPVMATPDTARDLGGGMAVSVHTPPADLPPPDRPIELEALPSSPGRPSAGSTGLMGVSLFTLSDNGVRALPGIARARDLLATSVLGPEPETVTVTVPAGTGPANDKAQAIDPAPAQGQTLPGGLEVISYRGEDVVRLSNPSEAFTINFQAPLGPLRGEVLIRREGQGNPILERVEVTDPGRVSFSADRRRITVNHQIRLDRDVIFEADFGNVSGLIPRNESPYLFAITDGGALASVAAPAAAAAAVAAPTAAGVGTFLVVIAVAAGVGVGIAAAAGAFSGGGGGGGGSNSSSR